MAMNCGHGEDRMAVLDHGVVSNAVHLHIIVVGTAPNEDGGHLPALHGDLNGGGDLGLAGAAGEAGSYAIGPIRQGVRFLLTARAEHQQQERYGDAQCFFTHGKHPFRCKHLSFEYNYAARQPKLPHRFWVRVRVRLSLTPQARGR